MVLLTVLRNMQRKEKQVRVLVLGLDNAGKSTLIARALNRPLDKVHPTFGFQIETVERGGLTLNVWDIGGQRSLRPFWHNYFEKTDFLIWVVDATAPERLESGKEELHEVLRAEEDQLVGAGLLIWINKIDAVEDVESTRRKFIEDLGLEEIVKHHNYCAVACSAYSGAGVEEGLDYVVAELQQRLYTV